MLFELDPEPLEETLTALGGIPLVVQACRSLGLPRSVQEHVRVKERARGYDEATFVESFVILNAAGGIGVEDFERLRGDPGWAEMIGHELPSPRAALEFLYAFHAEEKIAQAKQRRLAEQIAYIPEETMPWGGLSRPAHRHGGSGRHDHREPPAAGLDIYEGVRGYQPMLAVIAHNVLQALKRLALPAELLPARPKRLRFLRFHMLGRWPP